MKTSERKKTKRGDGAKRGGLFFFLCVTAVFVVLGSVAAFGYVAAIAREIPALHDLGSRKVTQSTKIYDRTGAVLLYEIHGEEKRTVVPFGEIPDRIKFATLAAEDADFYRHAAFNWKAIARAFIVNIREGKIVQGGSTITQQLVKNIFLTPEKTFTRKIRELILAIELESRYTKDQIFELYLNQIAYGANAYGVEVASQTYFGKSVRDISLAEAATLASLPKGPTYYSPWGSRKSELLERKDRLLDRMASLGLIANAERDGAKEEIMRFLPPSLGKIRAPHFPLMVRDELIDRYGEEVVTRGGLRVTTTLNSEMQEVAERVVREGAIRNESLYDGRNAALIAEDPQTGEVLALVGSRDYFDEREDGNFNVIAKGRRQPGSALKPFVYLDAFKKGYSPKTLIFDLPTEFASNNPLCPLVPDFAVKNKKCFHPQNFDDRFRGPVSFEEALAQSINVPSVKVLYLSGVETVLKTLRSLGVSTLKERGRYGLSLVLGGGEVKPIELVHAYAALAAEGTQHEQTLILTVDDSESKTLFEHRDRARRVIDSQDARLVNQILSDVELRKGLFQNSLSLTVFPDYEVALKTGTTNDYRDAWAVGYTPFLVVGVWAGNNDNTPMHRHGTSILAAVPIWSAFLNETLRSYDPETFTRPEPISLPTKPMLNGALYASTALETPQARSILYYVDKDDPLQEFSGNPYDDPQFINWETGVVEWARSHKTGIASLPSSIEGGGLAVQSTISIRNALPRNGAFVSFPLVIRADIEAQTELAFVQLSLNKKVLLQKDVKGSLYHLEYLLTKAPLDPQNTIEIRAVDKAGGSRMLSLIVFR